MHLDIQTISSAGVDANIVIFMVILLGVNRALNDCVSKQHASTSESNDSIYCVSSARSEAQVIYYIWKLLYLVALLSFLSDI